MIEKETMDFSQFVTYYNQLVDHDKIMIWNLLHIVTLDFDKSDIPLDEIVEKKLNNLANKYTSIPEDKRKDAAKRELARKMEKIRNPNSTLTEDECSPDVRPVSRLKITTRRQELFYTGLQAMGIPEVIYDSLSSNYIDDLKWLYEHAPYPSRLLIACFTILLWSRENLTKFCFSMDQYHTMFSRTEEYMYHEKDNVETE